MFGLATCCCIASANAAVATCLWHPGFPWQWLCRQADRARCLRLGHSCVRRFNGWRRSGRFTCPRGSSPNIDRESPYFIPKCPGGNQPSTRVRALQRGKQGYITSNRHSFPRPTNPRPPHLFGRGHRAEHVCQLRPETFQLQFRRVGHLLKGIPNPMLRHASSRDFEQLCP